MIPRTECAYLSLTRQWQRRNRNNTRSQYFHVQPQQDLQKLMSNVNIKSSPRNRSLFLQRNRIGFNNSNTRDVNKHLKKLAKERNWKEALKTVRECPCPDEVSYATAIDACSKAFKSHFAVQLFEEMKRTGISPNVPVYNAVMNACGRDHQWKKTLNFLRDMRANGVPPNIISYNVCLSALEKSKKWSMAVDMLRDIRKTGLSLQPTSYNTVISACAKSRKMDVAEKLLKMMAADGFVPDKFTYSSMLTGYRKIRDWESMFRIVEEMKEKKIPLDAVIYSTVIGACADAERKQKAFKLFVEMKKNKIQPNEVVYSCVLRACSTVQEAKDILNEMTQLGIPKNSVVFTSAINVCHKTKDVHQAIRWFEEMFKEGIHPDWVAYMSLFEVLSVCGRMEMLDHYYDKGLKTGVLSHFPKDGDKKQAAITLDLQGWSCSMARAAVRNVMNDYKEKFVKGFTIEPMTIVTGTGYSKNQPILRPSIMKMLKSEFDPEVDYNIVNGKIVVPAKNIENWIVEQIKDDSEQLLEGHTLSSSHSILLNEIFFYGSKSWLNEQQNSPFKSPLELMGLGNVQKQRQSKF